MKIARAQLELRDESAETPLYACQEPGCLVHYASSRGYFIVAQGANATEREMEPRVRCSKDGQLMFLAKVEPAKRSFRLPQPTFPLNKNACAAGTPVFCDRPFFKPWFIVETNLQDHRFRDSFFHPA